MLTTYQRQRYRTWADTEPMPAEDATEVGDDDDHLRAARGIGLAVIYTLAAMALLAAILVSFGGAL